MILNEASIWVKAEQEQKRAFVVKSEKCLPLP